jgi:hypothetical protein
MPGIDIVFVIHKESDMVEPLVNWSGFSRYSVQSNVV